MPLLLTTEKPFLTTAHVPVSEVYAIINTVGYSRESKTISFSVGYYTSEVACDAKAARLLIEGLQTDFTQAATPEEADAVPIFQFLEQVLTQQLQAQHPLLQITPDAVTALRYAKPTSETA